VYIKNVRAVLLCTSFLAIDNYRSGHIFPDLVGCAASRHSYGATTSHPDTPGDRARARATNLCGPGRPAVRRPTIRFPSRRSRVTCSLGVVLVSAASLTDWPWDWWELVHTPQWPLWRRELRSPSRGMNRQRRVNGHLHRLLRWFKKEGNRK
jgi:hypothetical protein